MTTKWIIVGLLMILSSCGLGSMQARAEHTDLEVALDEVHQSRHWQCQKVISDATQGLVSETDDRHGIEFRSYDTQGMLKSDVLVPLVSKLQKASGPTFAVERDGTVHLFWTCGTSLYGAIVNSRGSVVSGAKLIKDAHVGAGFLPIVVDEKKCIVGFSHEFCTPNDECPPCVRLIRLSLAHRALPPYDFDIDLVFDGAFSAAADGNGNIHLIYQQLNERTKCNELVIYYGNFSVNGFGTIGREIARGRPADFGQVGIACDASSKVHCYYTERKPTSAGAENGKLELRCVDIDNGKPCKAKRIPMRFEMDDKQLLIGSTGKQTEIAQTKADKTQSPKRRTYPMGMKPR